MAVRICETCGAENDASERFCTTCHAYLWWDAAEEATAEAEQMLAALTGFGLSALMDPTFDMRAHAVRLLPATALAGDRS
jgi:hypothetical protein